MVFYDYLLNIDTAPYEQGIKDRCIVESIVVRLEDVKKLLGLVKNNLDSLGSIEPRIAEYIEK